MNSISSITLSKTYGRDYKYILMGHLKALPKASRRGPTSFEILSELPTLELYALLRNSKHTTTVGSLVEDAKGEIETLAGELTDWKDSMPENLQGGNKADELDSAISELEGISIDDVDEKFVDVKVVFHPDYDVDGRASRASEASNKLRAAAEAIEAQYEADKKANDEKDAKGEPVEALDEYDYRSVAENLNEAADLLDNVVFPGAF